MNKKCISMVLLLIFLLTSVSNFAVAADSGEIADILGHEYQMKIEKMTEKGFFTLKNGNFQPNNFIVRGELAEIAAKLFRQSAEPSRPFNDVAISNVYSGYITALKNINVIPSEMISSNKFQPNARIKREEAAAILYRLFEYAYAKNVNQYAEITDGGEISAFAYNAVMNMCAMNFISTSDGKFRPQAYLTKAELADIVYNMFYTDESYTLKNGPGSYYNSELSIEVLEAYERGARKVTVQPGLYYLYNKCVTAPDYSRNSHFGLQYLKDFTLEGYNAKFVCCTPTDGTLGMAFYACEDFTVRGFTVDFKDLLYTQGEIVEVHEEIDNNYVVFDIDEGYPNTLDDTTYFPYSIVGYIYDSQTGCQKAGTPAVNLSITKVEGCERRWKGKNWNPATMKFFQSGDLFVIRMSNCSPFNTRFSDSRNVTVEDYTINAGGFGLLMEPSMVRTDGKTDKTVVRNVKITYGTRPEGATRDRLASTQADGIHLSYLSGSTLIENCLVEGCLDDAYATHGRHYMVADLGPEKNQYYIGTPYYSRVVVPGDRLAIYDEDSNLKGTSKVLTVEDVTETYKPAADASNINGYNLEEFLLVTLDEDIGINRLDYAFDIDAATGNSIMRGCVARNNIGRGALLQTWNFLVENCEFNNTGRAGIELAGEKHCAQGPYAKDITVKNCKFISCNRYGENGSTGLYLPSSALRTVISESGRPNENMVIDGCYFEDNYGADIGMGNVKGGIITNNIFGARNSFTKGKQLPSSSSVIISNSEDVVFDKSNIALTNRNMLEYQDVDNLVTDYDGIYSSSFVLNSANDGSKEWSYEYAPIGTNTYSYYNYRYRATGAWVRMVSLWSQDKESNVDYGSTLSACEISPGNFNDFVATFKAPYSGRIKILFNNGLYIREDKYSSDGIKIKVLKNDNQAVWPQTGWKTIKYGEPVKYIEDIYVNVTKGDKIRFRINANSTVGAVHDVLMFCPEIRYVTNDDDSQSADDKKLYINTNYQSVFAGVENAFSLKSLNLTSYNEMKYSSDNEKVATVDEDGLIVPLTPGVAVITARAGEQTVNCVVSVREKIKEGIRFSEPYITGSKGDKIQLKLETAEGIDTSKFEWNVANPNRAEVDQNGLLTIKDANINRTVVTAVCGQYKASVNVFIMGVRQEGTGGSFSSNTHFSTLNNTDSSLFQYMSYNENTSEYNRYTFKKEDDY